MNTIQAVRGRLWINGRRITNDLGLKNIDNMKIERAASRDRLGDCSFWLYPDTCEEMVEVLRHCYCGFIHFPESFRERSKHIWINVDSDLRIYKYRGGRPHPFLGEWQWPGWNTVQALMKRQWARRYIVRREWYEIVRGKLLESKVMPCQDEMCSLICVEED